MNKLFFFFAIVLLIGIGSSSLVAQTFEWADKSSATVLGNGNAIAVDAHGNSYVTGSFFGKIYFGTTELTSESRDIFLAKYDAKGKVLWARSAGGSADDFGNAVAIDKDGNCYLAGSFAATMILGKDTLKSHAQHDIFIAKYSSKGDVLWCKSAGGYYEDHAMAISVDKVGNCYAAGYFKDTLWFTPEKMIVGKRISYFDMFLSKYDSKGNFLWAKPIGGWNYQTQNEGLAITTDPKGITYLVGFYRNDAEFDKIQLTNKGSYAMFAAKYDADGKPLWVTTSTNDLSSVVGKGIAIDKKGNSYITGTFTASAGFDTINAVSKNMGYPEMFLAKYNSAGKIIWLRTSQGFGSKSPNAVAVDAQDNPYVFGVFRDTAIFGSVGVSGIGRENIMLIKYTAAGEPVWAKQVGRHGIVVGKAISIDAAGNIYMTGNFSDTADFGKAPLVAKENTQDAFIAKLSPHKIVTEKKLSDPPASDFAFLSCEINSKSRMATVKFSIPKATSVVLEVYDIMGRIVESFIEGQRDAGVYEVKLDMKGFDGDGEYYCRLQAGSEKQTKKMEQKK